MKDGEKLLLKIYIITDTLIFEHLNLYVKFFRLLKDVFEIFNICVCPLFLFVYNIKQKY